MTHRYSMMKPMPLKSRNYSEKRWLSVRNNPIRTKITTMRAMLKPIPIPNENFKRLEVMALGSICSVRMFLAWLG